MSDTPGAAAARSFWPAAGIGALMGVLLCTSMVWRTTSASFSGTSAAQGSWTAGSVTVTDDDAGQTVFSSAQDGLLAGGQSITRCITVSYLGSLVSGPHIRLHAAASGALAEHLDLVVDEGSGSAFGDCAGFAVSTAGLYDGTLAGFATSASSFDTGVGVWAPSVTPQSRSYRFRLTVRNVSAAQNLTATGAFTWEARS